MSRPKTDDNEEVEVFDLEHPNDPLPALLCHYFDRFQTLKQEHEEMDNLYFQRECGLAVKAPADWPMVHYAVQLLTYAFDQDCTDFVVIYPSTIVYRRISECVECLESRLAALKPTYFSWQELYVAMDRAGQDAREIQRFKSLLTHADLVVFFGAPDIPEIVDQVRSFCEKCLVIIS